MFPFLSSVALVSISGVMMPGPAFAVTVARSYRSQFVGLKIALGHAIVEVPLMLLIYFGFGRFFEREPVQIVLYLVGGAILILMGINMFRKRGSVVERDRELHHRSVIAGVATSLLNPLFFLWWAAVGSMLIMKSLTFGLIGFALLIIVHLLCDFGWLAFVSVLVYRTKSLWGGKVQAGLITACSLLLIGFGGWFLSSGLRLLA
ncbi:MAG: LysE family transporter [Dehalococcoidales bacterium]|nr:LysE family transporter [Dehalococcoidales bacterium]